MWDRRRIGRSTDPKICSPWDLCLLWFVLNYSLNLQVPWKTRWKEWLQVSLLQRPCVSVITNTESGWQWLMQVQGLYWSARWSQSQPVFPQHSWRLNKLERADISLRPFVESELSFSQPAFVLQMNNKALRQEHAHWNHHVTYLKKDEKKDLYEGNWH